MQMKVFTIPVVSGDQMNDELNRFLRREKIVEVEKQLIQQKEAAYWTFCVTYLPATSLTPSMQTGERRERIDYKQVLDEKTFAVFRICVPSASDWPNAMRFRPMPFLPMPNWRK